MTARKLFLAIGGVAALAAFAWAGIRYRASLAGPGDGDEPIAIQFFSDPARVPAVSMKTLDGQTISTADWRGKVTIVNFWATWCPPCRAEIPDLLALQEKYRGQVQIIGISQDEDPPAVVQQFADRFHINYPIVMSTPEIEKAFPGIYALPTSFIVDREGRVVQKHVGLLNPAITEQEARSLAGLPTRASVEYVEYEDVNKRLIKNAAQATKIPGVEIEKLSPAARTVALQKLNADNCTCGCALTLAACRINDPTCGISLPIARRVVQEAAASRP